MCYTRKLLEAIPRFPTAVTAIYTTNNLWPHNKHILFPPLHPPLHLLPALLDKAFRPRNRAHRVRFASLVDVFSLLLYPQMGVRNNWVLPLVEPDQVADVAHRVRYHGPAGGDAKHHGHGGTEQEVAVARDYGSGHCGDKDVDETGDEGLVGGLGGCERGDGVGEGCFKAERARHEVVDGAFGAGREIVELETRTADLAGKTVGGSR